MPGTPQSVTSAVTHEQVVDRYLGVWGEPDPDLRRAAITELWTPDGVEFVEGARFCGTQELDARITEAYQAFVETGSYDVTSAHDVTSHRDIVTFTIQLTAVAGGVGEVAWAARVFLVLDPDNRIREDYQLTVQPLPPAD